MKFFLRLPVFCGIALIASVVGLWAAEVEKGAQTPVAEVCFARSETVGSAVSLRVPAEALVLELSFSSDKEKMVDRLESLEAVEAALRVAATKAGLEMRAAAAPQVGAGYGKVGSSMSYLFGESGAVNGNYILLARLDASTGSLFPVAARLHAAATSLKLPKDISLRLGAQRLALFDVETRREALRARIAEHLKRDRAVVLGGMAAPELRLSGLDGPLQLAQLGERELAVWLPFKANYGGE